MNNNNKEIGTEFENELCDILATKGFWVHFITPNKAGAQPFDIIAVKNGNAYAIDCKTCKDHIFRMERLELNQILAFGMWKQCGNREPLVAIKHNDKVYYVEYSTLINNDGKINLKKAMTHESYDIVYDSVLGEMVIC